MEKINSTQEYVETQKETHIDIESARQHLDNAPNQYFEAINKYSEEEFLNFVKKLEPIINFLKNPHSIASVGVGGGLELRVLYELFKEKHTEIIGVDLSKKALSSARKYLTEHNVRALLVQSSAVEMPFKYTNDYMDGIVLSAIMHEIYSYVEDGKIAWIKAIQEASMTLSNNGVLLLRDFAGPEINDLIEISFLDQDVKDFYSYFRERFRTFDTWNKDEVEKMKDKRNKQDDYPILSEGQASVIMPFGTAAELMLHYRNYVSDFEELKRIGQI